MVSLPGRPADAGSGTGLTGTWRGSSGRRVPAGVPLPAARGLLRPRLDTAPHVRPFQVEPFASLSEAVRSSVPRVFMNQEAAGSLAWRPRSRDVLQLGELVDGVDKLVELLGWTEELKDLVQRETGQVQAQSDTDPGCHPGPARPGRLLAWSVVPVTSGEGPREAAVEPAGQGGGTQGPLFPDVKQDGSSRPRREAELTGPAPRRAVLCVWDGARGRC